MNALAAGALLVVAVATAQAAPPSVALTYDVTLNGMHVAVISERFMVKERTYHAVSETRAVGLLALVQRRPLRLASSGTVTRGGLRPDRFEGGRGDDDPRRAAAEFDWAAAQLTLTHDGRTGRLELPDGTQDRLSAMYQFMFLDVGRSTVVEFPMTNGRKLDRYRYTVTPSVPLDTPLGRIETLHLVKQREPGDTVTEIWLAPQYRHLPVKMLVIENDGSRYVQTVTSIDLKP
jgi:hypothetical protein